MAAALSDRELRRMILRLRSLSSRDFDAVIDELDESQRRKVLELLKQAEPVEHAADSIAAEASYSAVLVPPGISAWLVARINGRGDSGEETADIFELTPHAHARLRYCAAQMVPDDKKKSRGFGIFDRLTKAWS